MNKSKLVRIDVHFEEVLRKKYPGHSTRLATKELAEVVEEMLYGKQKR